MIIDSLGLPKDTGATDLQDSSRLAAIMVIFKYPIQPNLSLYIDTTNNRYVRHPNEYVYDFSRDQAICLLAGLYFQNKSNLVNRAFINGRDIFSPSHTGHIKRCQNKKSNLLEDMWLWVDVAYSCFVKPMSEPNQLLSMLMVADKKYLKFWLKYNKKWKEAIREYWSGWRGEPQLAEHMITYLEGV